MAPDTATATQQRTLPHNLEAERSVLGAILIDNDTFNVAAAIIDARAFFHDAHRRVFERMMDLSERSQPIDLVTLKEELERAGDLEEVGGPAYMASLVDGVPRSTNVEYYAQIVNYAVGIHHQYQVIEQVHPVVVVVRNDERELFLTFDKFLYLTIFQSITFSDPVQQPFLFLMHMSIHFRQCEQVTNVILFVREVLMFKKTNHVF